MGCETVFWTYTWWTYKRHTFGPSWLRQTFAFYCYVLLIILAIVSVWVYIIVSRGMVG